MASTLQEYLVSLGAEVDEKGIAKVHRALSTTKQAALGVMTALVGVVSVIAQTSVRLVETSQKYEQMARAQKKSTEEIRAQETALKVMGKTLKEVQADKVLNAQYEALLKVGKGMALPEASGGMLVLRGIIDTIEELKVKGTYALQWINHYLLNKLYLPLSRLWDGLRNFSMKLSANFPSWMERIAAGISYVVRLVGAGVEGVADLVGWIGKLPDGIKAVGAAIGVAFGASKLGPVGMTIAAITGLLLLLEDFYTWKNGTGPSHLGDFWQSISDGTLLSPEGVQAFLDRLDEVFGSVTEKVGQFLDIGTDITGKIMGGINSFDAEASGKTLGDFVSKIVGGILDVINGNVQFYNFAESVLHLVTTLCGKVASTLGTFLSSAEWGQMLESALDAGSAFINGVFALLLGKEGAEGTEAQQGLVDSIVGVLQSVVDGLGDGLKKISFAGLGEKAGAFITGIFEKIGSFFKKEGEADAPIMQMIGSGIDVIKSAFVGIVDFLSSALSSIEFSDVGDSINNALITVVKWVKYAFNQALGVILGDGEKDGLAGKILDFIRGALRGIGELVGMLDFFVIGTEIGTFVSGIFSQIGTFFEKEAEKAKNGQSIFSGFVDVLGKMLKGFGQFLSNAMSGIDVDDVKTLADGLWSAIQSAFSNLKDRITSEEIDISEIALNIGSSIGNAISIGTDFLSTLVSDIWNWLTGIGFNELNDIGVSIGDAIWLGFASIIQNLGDTLGPALFGDFVWGLIRDQDLLGVEKATEQIKKKQGIREKTNEVEAQAKVYEKYEAQARERWANEPEIQKIFANADAYAMYYTDDKFWLNEAGGTYQDWYAYWNARKQGLNGEQLYNSIFSSLYKTNSDAGSGAYVTPSDLYYQIARYPFETKFQAQMWNERLFADYGVSADWLYDRNGATVDVDNSKAQEAIKKTEESLDDIDGTTAETTIITNHVDNYTTNGGGSDGGGNSHSGHGGKFGLGGRFSSPTFGEIGEDDTEYLIPITKLSRARPLILQMFREMGSRANSILEDLGVPLNGAESIGGPGQPYYLQPAGMYPSAADGGSVKNNADNTVTSHATFNVYGSGDPERTGRAAVKAYEGNIIRAVRGCFEG